jgi:trehalose-6-phosphatase
MSEPCIPILPKPPSRVGDLQRFLGPAMLQLAGSHGADVRSPSGAPMSAARSVPAEVADQLGAYAAATGEVHAWMDA